MGKKRYYDSNGDVVKFMFYQKWWFVSLVTVVCMMFLFFILSIDNIKQENIVTEAEATEESNVLESESKSTEESKIEIVKVNKENQSNEYKSVITNLEAITVEEIPLGEQDINSLKEYYPAISSWIREKTYMLYVEYSVDNNSDQDVRQPTVLDIITTDGQQLDSNYIVEMGQVLNNTYISGGNVNTILSGSNKQTFYNTYVINPETLNQLTSIKANISGISPVELYGFGEEAYDMGWTAQIELINK